MALKILQFRNTPAVPLKEVKCLKVTREIFRHKLKTAW